jgi:hypothetical protein
MKYLNSSTAAESAQNPAMTMYGHLWATEMAMNSRMNAVGQ